MKEEPRGIAWYRQGSGDVLSALQSRRGGLSVEEAQHRLKTHGPNTLPKQPPASAFRLLLSQFTSPFMVILVFAAGVSLVLGEWFDVIVILLAVLVNVVLGFFEEFKADRSLLALQQYLPIVATVRRGGEVMEVPSDAVVEGDIMLLSAGDKITADGRILSSQAFSVSESALTGESAPVKKKSDTLDETFAVADQVNMVFAGTAVVSGHAEVVVTGTGVHTEIGHISSLVGTLKDEKTPLQEQLARFARVLGLIVLILAAIIFFSGVLSGQAVGEMFYLAVALSVAAVPEGLVVAVTVILAIGMQRILKKKALVRKLVAAETLGSVSVICMDKTGTLTTGVMEVTDIRVDGDVIAKDGTDPRREAVKEVVRHTESVLAERAADGTQQLKGTPTEMALVRWADGPVPHVETNREHLVAELPFDSAHKYAARSYRKNGGMVLYALGAPEVLIGRADVNDDERAYLFETFEEMTQTGLRVLVAATGVIQSHKELTDLLVQDLAIVGFIGLSDPLREEALETVQQAKAAGLRPVMITGDHPETARNIAEAAGFLVHEAGVMTGAELDELNDEEFLARVDQIHVFARVVPKHKLRIIRAWKARGASVAMTGDGVNDAPALKAADIGIALGSGTEVAKETSDIVLLDNNFRTIIDAIREGRIMFDNMRKMIVYYLIDSTSEIILVLGAILLGFPLPILPAQILWINLIADGLPSIALTFEPGERGIMNDAPRPKNAPILNGEMKALILLVGLLTDVLLFGIFFTLYGRGLPIEEIRTVIFLALGVDSLVYIFAVRTFRESIFVTNPFKNRFLLIAVLIGVLMLLLPLEIPSLRRLFDFTELTALEWMIVSGLAFVQLIIIEVIKELYNRHRRQAVPVVL